MKTEKEILERIEKYYNEIEIFKKLINKRKEENAEFLGLEIAIMIKESSIIDLEWAIGRTDFEDNLFKRILDNK